MSLAGYVGHEPEHTETAEGRPLTILKVVLPEHSIGSNRPVKAEWFRVSLYAGLSTRARRMIKKGTPIYVEGRVQQRRFIDGGVHRDVYEVQAERMFALATRADSITEEPHTDDSAAPDSRGT